MVLTVQESMIWPTRALELNNREFWNWIKACERVAWAINHQFNTIVVGQVDLFDQLVSPKGYTPHQYNDRLSSQQLARCVYLNHLARYCQKHDLKFYLQAKEFSFPADLLVAHPQLIDKDAGASFNTDFWCRYLSDKMTLLCQRMTAIYGMTRCL